MNLVICTPNNEYHLGKVSNIPRVGNIVFIESELAMEVDTVEWIFKQGEIVVNVHIS